MSEDKINDNEIAAKVGQLLKDMGLTLAVAESCTGGLLGHRITSVSGSSEYFVGGVISYSNEVKVLALGVGRDMLREHGAVSDVVAMQMAKSVRGRLGADIGMGVTGIAGPTGGTDEKPIGLVYVGLADGKKTRVCRFDFKEKDRNSIKDMSCNGALEMLYEFLKGVKDG